VPLTTAYTTSSILTAAYVEVMSLLLLSVFMVLYLPGWFVNSPTRRPHTTSSRILADVFDLPRVRAEGIARKFSVISVPCGHPTTGYTVNCQSADWPPSLRRILHKLVVDNSIHRIYQPRQDSGEPEAAP